MKKSIGKVFSLILAVMVITLAGTLLGFVDSDNSSSFDMPKQEITQLASTKTTLTPIMYTKYDVINYPEEVDEFKVIQNNVEFIYGGQSNPRVFKVEWQEGHNDIVPTLTFYKKDKVSGEYILFQESIVNVGEYKIVLNVSDPNYEIQNKEFFFKITPFVSAAYPDKFRTYTYKKEHVEPSYKTKPHSASRFPDNKWYTTKRIEKFDVETGDWIPVEESINVGKYRVYIDLIEHNDNYVITNMDELVNNAINYEIVPAPLTQIKYLKDPVYNAEDRIKDIDFNIKTSIRGFFSGDMEISNITYSYYKMKDPKESFKNENLVSTTEIKDVGSYAILGEIDNPNYVVDPVEIKVTPKSVFVILRIPRDLEYTGNTKDIEIVQEGLFKKDNVKLFVTYNGSKEAPIKAGKYNISYIVEGDRKFNYTFNKVEETMEILKAQWKYEDFVVSIRAKKIIVIDTIFEGIQVKYSIDGINWQDSPKFVAEPMHEYEVKVKLLEDENHFEKIITKKVRTGFDPVIFAEKLETIDFDNFSFKDVAKYNDILWCKTFIADEDKKFVDYEKLAKLDSVYTEYVANTNEVVNDAYKVSNKLEALYAVPVASALALGLGLLIRRKRNDKE